MRSRISIMFACVLISACTKFPVSSSIAPATAEVSFSQGEFQNKYTTYVTDARASWMVGEKNGVKYSLIAIGRSGVVDGYEDKGLDRLKYDQLYLGGKISEQNWNVSASGNADKYRFEAELVLPVTEKLSVMPGVRHENAWDQGKKQTTLRVGGQYQLAKGLYTVVAAEIENVRADSVNDHIGVGLKYEF